MSISFQQLIEMLQQPDGPVDRMRYCAMTSDVIHIVLHVKEAGNGFGEVFLTREQFTQLRKQFPNVNLVETGTFPLPPK